ncbi:MAG: hypothetical protein GEV08_20810 [Acidimicrobiia bacterium]|nr:hypothetical protein [Acidimicrobiia bacterium]
MIEGAAHKADAIAAEQEFASPTYQSTVLTDAMLFGRFGLTTRARAVQRLFNDLSRHRWNWKLV